MDRTHESETAGICGYTEKEMDDVLEKFELSAQKSEVNEAYNGYLFSTETKTNVYIPFAINHYLPKKSTYNKFNTY